MTEIMLEREYAFFKSIRDQLVKEHLGQSVVIKDESILGFYASDVEAIRETQKTYPMGTFIVQKCVPEDQEMQKFYSRVTFA